MSLEESVDRLIDERPGAELPYRRYDAHPGWLRAQIAVLEAETGTCRKRTHRCGPNECR